MLIKRFRTIWISDLHLGSSACNAPVLSQFLSQYRSDVLYLNGDIFDIWNMKRSFLYFPQSHVNIVRKLLSKARHGTKIKYIIGNHDEFFRQFISSQLTSDNICAANEFVHQTVTGHKMLVTHGDLYDAPTAAFAILSHIGDIGYTILLKVNKLVYAVQRIFKLPHWSLANFIKRNVKQAVNFINAFEESLARECTRRNLDAVVCGHIHYPEIRHINKTVYVNSGDFCENCSAILEDYQGNLHLVRYNNDTQIFDVVKTFSF